MARDYDFNPFTGNLDEITVEGSIPEYTSDPSPATPQTAWVLKGGSGATGGGVYKATLGLGFPFLSKNSGGSTTYQLSYKTLEGTTVRATLI